MARPPYDESYQKCCSVEDYIDFYYELRDARNIVSSGEFLLAFSWLLSLAILFSGFICLILNAIIPLYVNNIPITIVGGVAAALIFFGGTTAIASRIIQDMKVLKFVEKLECIQKDFETKHPNISTRRTVTSCSGFSSYKCIDIYSVVLTA